MINQFGNLLAENKVVFIDVDELFKKLADYAQYHFQKEEALMVANGIDPRHIEHHIEAHRSFLQEITAMHSLISQANLDSAKQLLNFLSHWLAYHILGIDLNMARQIKAIQSGVEPVTAYETEKKSATKRQSHYLLP